MSNRHDSLCYAVLEHRKVPSGECDREGPKFCQIWSCYSESSQASRWCTMRYGHSIAADTPTSSWPHRLDTCGIKLSRIPPWFKLVRKTSASNMPMMTITRTERGWRWVLLGSSTATKDNTLWSSKSDKKGMSFRIHSRPRAWETGLPLFNT